MNKPDSARPGEKLTNQPRPMTGNEAIARGAWEAGVKVTAAYPGTPSTEILENMATYDPEDVVAHWSTNEKVSVDTAIGASLSGVRAMASMKHVGLNVASDSVMSVTYIGVHAGLVIVVCDDPGLHSSQNEQDTRVFARLSNIPVLEPADAQEALEFTRLAFDLSETFDTPVIVRATTRLSHTRSLVFMGPRKEAEPRSWVGDSQKTVMIPGYARIRHPQVVERIEKLTDHFSASPLNRWDRGDSGFGVITHGTCYPYVKEVAPEASVLKLAASYPLPEKLIREFAATVERVIVVEELEPVLEVEIRSFGVDVEGKEFFPRVGELSPELVREGLAKAGLIDPPPAAHDWEIEPLTRPPVLCAGCPHITCYMALRAIDALVPGDIGCYTLAAVEPLKSIDVTVCMGASIGNAIGMAKANTTDRPVVATIGDSTFLHSGIPPLIDAVYNNANIAVLILDNKITAMTGGQDHPGTGKTLRGEDTHQVEYEELCRSIGVKWVKTVDSYDTGEFFQALREATEFKSVSVLISNRPCVLDPVKIKGPALVVKAANCTACQACMNLGCPAITWIDELFEDSHKVEINPVSCIGCTLCAQICPTDCIQPLPLPAAE